MKILKFQSEDCSYCKQVDTVLVNLGATNVEKVDAFERADLSSQYGVFSVPVTILLDDNGQEVMRSIGFNPGELQEIVDQM